MRIEFLKDHGVYRAGAVVDHPHPGVADVLVRRGIARPAPAGKPATRPLKKPR